MFLIRKDPSSSRFVQCLAENYKNNFILSVDMDKVGVMAAYCDCNQIKQGRFQRQIDNQNNMKWEENTDVIKYNVGLTPLCLCLVHCV